MEIHGGNHVPRRRRLVGGAAATLGAVAALSIVTLALATGAFAAQAPVNLGTTASYAVLAGTTVTNTGPTTVGGNLGLSAGSSVTGFPPGLVSGGVQNVANAAAVQAQSDLVIAYNDAAGRTPATTVAGDTLGGLTLTAGVYSGGALDLTGTLTLDAQGDSGAVFIFQAASTLITASASQVKLVNGASPCNVFWQVGSSATLGTTTSFKGTILALTSIGLNTGATVDGRLLARNGAVTLDSNTINAIGCSGSPGRSVTQTVTQVHNSSHADVTNGSVVAGTAVHDSATVTGASPSGTITYHFFATGSGGCSGASTDQTVAVGTESSPQTLAVGSYAYSADYSGDSNNQPSTGVCEPFKVVSADTTPPICRFYLAATNRAGQATLVNADVQDTGSGLASILVLSASNATVQMPSFAVGTTRRVTVQTTIVNLSQPNEVWLEIKDLAGIVTRCDPIVMTLHGLATAGVSARSFLVPQRESKLQVVNGNRGLTRIDVVVNGRTFRLSGLRPGQRLSVDLASAMHRGSSNRVTFVGYGRSGATAVVLLAD
jgi:hypothetical protein